MKASLGFILLLQFLFSVSDGNCQKYRIDVGVGPSMFLYPIKGSNIGYGSQPVHRHSVERIVTGQLEIGVSDSKKRVSCIGYFPIFQSYRAQSTYGLGVSFEHTLLKKKRFSLNGALQLSYFSGEFFSGYSSDVTFFWPVFIKREMWVMNLGLNAQYALSRSISIRFNAGISEFLLTTRDPTGLGVPSWGTGYDQDQKYTWILGSFYSLMILKRF